MAFLTLMGVLLSLISCKRSNADAFAFREMEFCAEVEWEDGGERFCARVYNKPSQKLHISDLDVSVVGEQGQRRIEYVLPKELQNIKVEMGEDGKYEARLGDAYVHSASIERLGFVLCLIFLQGSTEYVCRESMNGTECDVYCTSSELGKAEYFINRSSKMPLKIRFNGVDFDFVWIEVE